MQARLKYFVPYNLYMYCTKYRPVQNSSDVLMLKTTIKMPIRYNRESASDQMLIQNMFFPNANRSAGGAFGKMEAAREEEYFRRLVSMA